MLALFPEEGRDGVGVRWDPDLEGEPFVADDSAVEIASDELEVEGSAVNDILGCWGRWEMGKSGSARLFLLRGSLKKVVVVWTV